MKKIEFTTEQTQDIIKKYLIEKISMNKIGEIYGVSKQTIRRILVENQITIKKDNHIYYADYDIFEKIDTQEKAYWLGFIAADGCVYERKENASLIINISSKDRKHLEKFKKFINTNAIIQDYIQNDGFSNNQSVEMSKLTLNSVKLVNDLKAVGIVPRKSLILDIPKIDKEFYFSYILGYFDGDGSIYKSKQYNNYGISFVGTKETLEWINSLLNISEHLEQRVSDSEKNNYYIRCGGTEKPYNILKKLYSSCSTHLDRKFLLYQALESVVLNRNIE